jgi:RimJ/RimL family protein N-acetyltransferase
VANRSAHQRRVYFLRTSRLGFDVWSESDAALATGLWGDSRVTRWIGGPFTEQWVKDRLAQEIALQSTHGLQYWPIFRLSDDAHVGCCGLRPVPDQVDALELGIHLRPEYWGQGLATEAARAVIKHAFTAGRTTTLVAGHHPQNLDSPRVLQRLGFRYTHDELYAPTGLQHLNYALSAADFAVDLPSSGGRL